MKSLFFLIFFCSHLPIYSSPFKIAFEPKEDLTIEDYVEIQRQIRAIDIEPLIRDLYPPDQGLGAFVDFVARSSRGLWQTLINPDQDQFPSMELSKIGAGSDCCIVSCAPYDGLRSTLIDHIPHALKECGFNGYFLSQKGGFPNPSGNEIRYVGVPYSFKIFLMLEAFNRGFNKVLWIDSAVLPLKDLSPIFNLIEKNHAFLQGWECAYCPRFILPQTRDLLMKLTGIDVLNTTYLNTTIFGLKMNSPRVKALVRDFYQCAEMGTPFLSCFPEEFVLTALTAKPRYPEWVPLPAHDIMTFEDHHPEGVYEQMKNGPYYFWVQRH